MYILRFAPSQNPFARLTSSLSGQRPFAMVSTRLSNDKVTFKYQDTLPALPVPSISSTAAKYFRSVLPIVSPQQPRTPTASDTTPTPAYTATKAAVQEFTTSPLVAELQRRLVSRAEEPGRDNWLIEWWNELAYMGYREPLIPFSSYYIAHLHDKRSKDGPGQAARFVRGMMYFRDLIMTEQLPPEKTRHGPLCMNSYSWLFNTCRYPSKPSDFAKKFDPKTNQHITVIRKGKFFEFDLVRKYDGEWLSVAELESQFRKVIQLAGHQETSAPIGALTTEHRDTWADAREELVISSPQNVKSLERIESSVICVALDDSEPITRDELGRALWSGDGKNRFFDKQQLIVFENGQSGFNAEHSCMDGTPVATMNDWVLSRLANSTLDLGPSHASSSSSQLQLPDPQPINFEISSKTQESISKAVQNHIKLMSAQSHSVLQYVGYGKSTIKNIFKSSPDAIAQLIMQLGYYKLFGKVPVTYESAQTRKFKLGRTEVIRSCTIEALEWCKAMEDPDESAERKLELFRAAEKAHVRYGSWASNGEGVDRHLLGLRMVLKPGEEKPSLFTDPVYGISTAWTLSTSTLPSEYFNGLGYGPVVDDGFGLPYAVNEHSIRYTVTTATGHGERLVFCLQEAAEDIKAIMLNAPQGHIKAKL